MMIALAGQCVPQTSAPHHKPLNFKRCPFGMPVASDINLGGSQPLGSLGDLEMKRFALSIILLGVASCSAQDRTAFSCPDIASIQASSGIHQTTVQMQQLAFRLGIEVPQNRNDALNELRSQYPKATPDEVVDYALAAYCPAIATNPDLSDTAKAQKFDQFSDRVNRIVSGRKPS